MVTVALALVAAGILFSQSRAGARAINAAAQADFAFVGVTVVPMDRERILENHTVLIRDGRIVALGPSASTPVPAGAAVVNASGKYLMPGLAEMHAHIPGATTLEQLIHDIMFMYVANGVTTIRGMLGAPNQLTLREQTASGEVIGPTIFVGAPSLNGQTAPTTEAAARLIHEHKQAGYDFLKLHPGISRVVYDTIVQVAREVGITFAGHISAGVGLAPTLEARQSTIDHLDGYLEASVTPGMHQRMAAGPVPFNEMVAAVQVERLGYWAARTREAGTWNVPTAFLWETFYSLESPETLAQRPEMRYAPPQMVEAWMEQKRRMSQARANQGVDAASAQRYLGLRRMTLKALADSGAGLLMGTDSPQMFSVPGFSVHNEIGLMQEAGLTPYQVLESGTRNVARYASEHLGLDGAFGTVAVGNRADLILVDANPLADARNVKQLAGVMVRGRWLPADELTSRLDAIVARHRAE